MGTLWFDFGAVLFLVAAMILISRLQDVISSEDKDGYRYMSGGIALLAVVSLLNLLRPHSIFKTRRFPLF